MKEQHYCILIYDRNIQKWVLTGNFGPYDFEAAKAARGASGVIAYLGGKES